MERIVVIGCGGSGKTHLARQLAGVLCLPLTHLDGVYYDAEWHALSQEEFAARQRELVGQTRWVIEGNYASTLPMRLAAADTVIFLDLPAVTCLLGILQRRWRYRGGQHSNDGVFDRVTTSFVRYIWGYRREMRPRVQRLIAEHGTHARLVTLRSRNQATRWLRALRTSEHARNEANTMRPLPRSADYGAWNELPVDPRETELDMSNQDLQAGIKRRDVLKTQWAQYWRYPLGTWRAEEIAAYPEQAEAWRNWFLRRSWEAIAYLNGCLSRWSR